MRKDITKKFLGKENRYAKKILSKGVSAFISRKKINRGNQISIDVIEFHNVFSTEFTNLNTKNILESGDKLREIVSKNGKRIEFNMIYCLEGTLTMGSNVEAVIATPFLLGETEVTQESYELVMDYNPSRFKGKKDSSQRPVECVTWYDAIDFCNKLSVLLDKSPYYKINNITYFTYHEIKQSIKEAEVEILGGNGFRLPLSKEWKYAARAGTKNKYAGTNVKRKLEEYAWFEKNSNKETHPVATKKPNEWGFYDMSGNVFEWCSNQSIGGGSFFEEELYLYSNIYDSSSRFNGVFSDMGFRVAASL